MDPVLEIGTRKKVATEIYFPESDGKPMAETDIHRQQMMDLISAPENHFSTEKDVYVSGNLFF